MRNGLIMLGRKLKFRIAGLYTWLHKGRLQSHGEGLLIEFPVRLEQPQGMRFGKNVHLYPRVWLNCVANWAGGTYNGQLEIGDRTIIGYGVQISSAGRITIEEDVAIAQGAVIVDHIHDYRHADYPIFLAPLSKPKPVHIGKGSFLGVNCFIAPGVRLGEHVMVAANAVVLKDVPSNCMAAGNPGRVVRYRPYTAKPTEAEVMQEVHGE